MNGNVICTGPEVCPPPLMISSDVDENSTVSNSAPGVRDWAGTHKETPQSLNAPAAAKRSSAAVEPE